MSKQTSSQSNLKSPPTRSGVAGSAITAEKGRSRGADASQKDPSRSAAEACAPQPPGAGADSEAKTRPVHLKTGCYLIRFIPNEPLPEVECYDGTLRISREKEDGTLVEAHEDKGDTTQAHVIKGSADLYEHSTRREEAKQFDDSFEKFKEKAGIPSFPRSAYRYYLEGLQVLERLPSDQHVTARFRVHRFDSGTRSFVVLGNRVCILYRLTVEQIEQMVREGKDDPRPSEFRNCTEYYGGRIIDETSGSVVGKVRVGRISDKLRLAEVEIDCVGAGSVKVGEPNKISGGSLRENWTDAFKGTGWEVSATISDQNVEEPTPNEGDPDRPPGAWTLTELHQALMQRRDPKDLDQAWHYYVLCVRRLVDFERGVMFDAGGMDEEGNIPHDVIGVAADWPFPKGTPWDKSRLVGKLLEKTNGYFRTAVHELGHAMGLDHNFDDHGFMNTTDVIANEATPKNPFPDNARWVFHSRDQARLRHESDARVRADTSFEGGNMIQPDAQEGAPVEGLRLHVASHLSAVPYGAPVRVQFHLENTSPKPIQIPKNLSIKAGNVSGSVVDPSGRARAFSAVVWRLDDDQFKDLAKKSRDDTYSATLLRGPDGALFRVPGPHRIRLDVRWADGTSAVSLTGETTVTVTPPADEDHRLAALIVLATPETLLSLVIGGDHLMRGNAAVDAAIKNPVLKPHFALIEAKRLAHGYRPCKKEGSSMSIKWDATAGVARGPRLSEALALIEENTVLAPEEIRKVALLIDQGLQLAAAYANANGKTAGLADMDEFMGSVASRQIVARLGKMLNEKTDRLIAYGVLRSKDKTVEAVRKLPQSEAAVEKKFGDYFTDLK